MTWSEWDICVQSSSWLLVRSHRHKRDIRMLPFLSTWVMRLKASFVILVMHWCFNYYLLRHMFIIASVFHKIGSDRLGTKTLSYISKLLNFRQHFGVTPHACDVIRKQIKNNVRAMCRNFVCFGLCVFYVNIQK